jgi:hypothetical protein
VPLAKAVYHWVTPHRPPLTSTRPVAIAINKMRKGRKIDTMPIMARGSFQGLSPRFSAALFQYLISITNTLKTHLSDIITTIIITIILITIIITITTISTRFQSED